ncbi:ABC transporter ATP-binding protein [Desulfovibrio desulfuricans]|uniref:ABC transporter ATP-binding protein n=1 Tax=Desulfovibrio desulfuricans TaxID=876 RepID=UPI0003B4ACF9|nr:ABC transporter ATP-binding protein [Desulfovibrio desulfuricans]MDD3683528.1 ABC transporter ATP-binding protein [Desulfovibrio desulfuricans]QTO41738.1 ABC transporter ATP-binding protein [Desulfovibrio desulfuricans]
MSAIRLENVCKKWGATHAVQNVSFEINEGSLLVLLGPSGCGKSTTLRLIAGLESVSGGRIYIGDRDVTDLPPADRHLAMVFQSYALFPHLTVRENILFGLKVRKVPEADQMRRLDNAVDVLGLSGLLERKPSALSGGQQQRVALGRALVAEAAVCLMDEPLSNLDAKLRLEMRREIRDLQQRLGMTMVYVTHDQTEAMSMADTIILMQHGHIVQNDAPVAMYSQPATTFAASFIGTPPMNLLNVAMCKGQAVIKGNECCPVPGAVAAECTLGIRPENIQVTPDGPWEAEVLSMEYLGADSVLACSLGQQQVAVQMAGNPGFKPGHKLRLNFAADALHFFEAESGKRMGAA